MQLKFYRYDIIFALNNAERIKMLENCEKIVCSNWINVLAKKIGMAHVVLVAMPMFQNQYKLCKCMYYRTTEFYSFPECFCDIQYFIYERSEGVVKSGF